MLEPAIANSPPPTTNYFNPSLHAGKFTYSRAWSTNNCPNSTLSLKARLPEANSKKNQWK